MVSTDIGNICSVSNSYLRFDKPASFFAAMAFGNCGYAFPAAMGAKVKFQFRLLSNNMMIQHNEKWYVR